MSKRVTKMVTSLVLISLLLSGCKSQSIVEKQPELREPVNVSTKSEKATYRDIYSQKTYTASVVPYSDELAFDTDGMFDKYHVSIGDKVKKGQEIASQSDEMFEVELKQIKNNYEVIKTSYDNEKKINDIDLKILKAKLDKEKANLKKATGANKKEIQYYIDKLTLDEQNLKESSEQKYKEYQRQLKECNDKIDQLNKLISSNSIVAPFDGTVVSVTNMELGSAINRGVPVVKIVDTSKSYITCDLSMLYIVDQASAYYGIFNGKKYELKFTGYVNTELLDASLESAQEACKFTLKNKEDKLELGDTGLLSLVFDYKKNVLAVTNKAIFNEGFDTHYVYRIKDGKKEKVYVETGIKTDIYTEITKGLQEGDVVFDE